jgi:hypothetical protein
MFDHAQEDIKTMEENEFTVRDRRTTSAEEAATENKDSPKQQAAAEQKPAETAQPQEPKITEPMPEPDFTSFIFSIATTAQMSLGGIQHPDTGKVEQNLPAAKQMIDILGIMKDKTKGNLTKDEETLLESALYNLRMQYVRAKEGK